MGSVYLFDEIQYARGDLQASNIAHSFIIQMSSLYLAIYTVNLFNCYENSIATQHRLCTAAEIIMCNCRSGLGTHHPHQRKMLAHSCLMQTELEPVKS